MKISDIHIHTQPLEGPLSGTTWVGRYQKKHSLLTPMLFIRHPLSNSSIYYDPQHPPYSIYVLDSPFPQPLQVLFGLALLGLGPSISHYIHILPDHYLLFATHTHTTAACFAVVLRL